jgi:hypothetical protein
MHLDYKSKENRGGRSTVGLFLLIFIILKLTGVIDWNWMWILSPLWIGAILAIIILAIVGIGFVFGIAVITKWFNSDKEKNS